jgi:hypothetical protein
MGAAVDVTESDAQLKNALARINLFMLGSC